MEVYVKLERPSDGEVSNSIKFVYKPSEKNLSTLIELSSADCIICYHEYFLLKLLNSTGRKRPRIASGSGSMELANNTTRGEQLLNNCVSETFMTLPVDAISSVSQELSKLLSEGECSSQEISEFINNNKSGLDSKKIF